MTHRKLQHLEMAVPTDNLVLAIDGWFWYLFVIPLNFWNEKALFCTSAKHLYLYIENFPMTVGKKVILRAISYWRDVGTEKRIQEEESRHICPKCGNKVFRGAVKCNQCKAQLDLE